MPRRAPLGAMLQKMGVVTFEQVEEAIEYQRREGCRLGEALIALGYAAPADVMKAIAKQFHLPFIELKNVDIPVDVVAAVSATVAREHKIIPIRMKSHSLTVALDDPLDFVAIDDLRFILNKEIECVLATNQDIESALVRYYGADDVPASGRSRIRSLLDAESESEITLRGVNSEEADDVSVDDTPVIKLVNTIISEAVKQRASDIHIEPFADRLRIRYRVDGVCIEQESPPKRLQGAVISRIKIMSGMDMAEKRRPQDGGIKMKFLGKGLDFRVSVVPSTWGESIVMRILDKEESLVTMGELGFHESDEKRFKEIIKRPNGLFLVTGPTGCGKTTTLYGALQELNKPNIKIITAEDPVEYQVDGINQCQVNRKVGLTFARIIRSMLRQAPNVILVGEIRDMETAETAIQAALTGHLVFSTLHTNDAPSALPRLIDLGVKPFLVSSGIVGVMAQRLLRVLCPNCKELYTPSESEYRAIGLTKEQVDSVDIFRPVGCGRCYYRGYFGRTACFELMEMTVELKELTFRKSAANIIRRQAQASGMLTLQQDAARKVLAGQTSIAEVMRITTSEEFTRL